MDTNGLTKSEKTNKISIGKGDFTPSEASDVIMSLIDEKLIFIKTKAQNWEQNHKSNSDEIDERINQLEKKAVSKILLLTLEIRKVI
jgi:CTP:phosphocholine cytidylyltransferase-like protein